MKSNIKDKGKDILDMLDFYFPEVHVPLDHKDPYTLLIAVLLSAQCTDERVNKVTPELFSRASSPVEMIKLTIDEIQEIIRPCGLSQKKATAIWELSQLIIKNYNAQVPDTMEALECLPGVGHKTASVVLSQAFNIPSFPVDTHIHRLAHRWGLSSGKNVMITERDLKKVFPEDTWNKVHLQMIFYGRTYCKARAHVIDECPICKKWGNPKDQKG
jgi:endonuclease III